MPGLFAAVTVAGCATKPAPANSTPNRVLAGKIYGDADAGRATMERWCVSCHREREPLADQPAPPLAALVANTDRSERAIRAFLMHPHAPMPPLELSNQMIEDIVAYLRRLKGG